MKSSPPHAPLPSLTVRPPAKINWFLKITGKRNDGYHEISSLMQCVSLYDIIVLEHADTIDILSDSDIPVYENIVYKSAIRLKQYASYKKGSKIILKKNIPLSAGLGGGSSDAAYVLSGLNILWGLRLTRSELNAIAAGIGSDVPFFLNGPFALVEGTGEKVTPLKIDSALALLLVKPPLSVSTAWAYTNFDKQPYKLTKIPADIKLISQALAGKDSAFLNDMLNNDLEKVVVREFPVVSEIKSRMLDAGAVFSAMSGSGPTVFGVFRNRDAAEKAACAMQKNWCRVVETLI